MARKFNELIKVIKQSVDTNDVFGLNNINVHQMSAAGQNAFAFPRSADKLNRFMTWLERQVQLGILEVGELQQVGISVESVWTNKYILDSYKRGVQRARYELIQAGYRVPSIESTGGIELAIATPFHIDRLGLLYTRTYSELKGITDIMDSLISRVLSQGIADGDNPRLLARKLVSVINGSGVGELGITDTLGRFIPAATRADMLARTEIIRAHHVATIQEYRNWGVAGVNVLAEVVTAEDNRVCSRCETIAKGGPYTLDQVEKMIPVHPRCRCVALPLKV
jgi:SPP1 gp7 family putative phage head morphogenesis protein